MKILFAAAEAYPLVKAGGLADVAGALPKALARLGHEVSLLLPGYPGAPAAPRKASLTVPMGHATEEVVICEPAPLGNVRVFTANHQGYLCQKRLYGYENDDVLPFILFSKAATAFAALPEVAPDVIHCNDWPLGLAPQYARQGPDAARLERSATLLTIHNLAYQGWLGPEAEAQLGLCDWPSGSLLARGIASADTITTVSRQYRDEILTHKYGMGMEELLRSRNGDLVGVLNGVDYEEFGPSVDPHIPARYGPSSLARKGENKRVLQQRSGLAVNTEVPLLGMVARLVEQKGINLLIATLDEIVALGVQVAVMGVGTADHERALAEAAARHAGSVAYHSTDEEALARLVYAGSDFFLAPSAFEPCGLGPLIALRYGSVPIVRRTGGLAETIPDYGRDSDAGLGFTFIRKFPGHLVSTIKAALGVYQNKPEYRALQMRGMTADFSWDGPSREYERLYGEAIARRREALKSEKRAQNRRPTNKRAETSRPVPLALVHHANQYLITNGYTDRQGLSEILDGYSSVLRMHEERDIPLNLHLSGTLIETIAWHSPWFLELVKSLKARGLLSLIGGATAENVMTLFPASHNLRQLNELLWLYDQHLDCSPEELSVCWVPERVWDTERLAPILTSPALANGGYSYVLLDDRLLLPANGSQPKSPRAAFDSALRRAVEGAGNGAGEVRDFAADTYAMCEISGANGLSVIPMSSELRYWIPPRCPDDLRKLEARILSLRGDNGSPILVYADDLERTAGVGGWDSTALVRYRHFLDWVASSGQASPIRLTQWASQHPPQRELTIERGTFFELARLWGAGDDYRRWWDSAAWRPYRADLKCAHEAVARVESESADGRLVDLAWKHLLASGFETAWHDPGRHGRKPAPWARAIASHSRACLVIAAAARWFAPRADRPPGVRMIDIDQDGEQEAVIYNDTTFAVTAPERGGRLVYLFSGASEGGVLVVGNPTDDWNFQEELNRFMDEPPNHPGALCDLGFEHDRYQITNIQSRREGVLLEMTNQQPGSPLLGTVKSIFLAPESPALTICYRLPEEFHHLAVNACLSPDYYRLLREGRRGLSARAGQTWRGFRNRDAAVWLALAEDEETTWAPWGRPEVGHGLNLLVKSRSPHFHFLLGTGETDDAECHRLIESGSHFIHEGALENNPGWKIPSLEVCV